MQKKHFILLAAIFFVFSFSFAEGKVVSGSSSQPYGESPCYGIGLTSTIMCGNCMTECKNDGKGYYKFDTDTYGCECSDKLSDSNAGNGLNVNECFEELLKGEEAKIVPLDNADGETIKLSELYGEKGTEEQKMDGGNFNIVGGPVFRSFGSTMTADTRGGRALRGILNWTIGWGKVPETYTYDQPRTSEFFQNVDSIQGTQTERIRRTYDMVNEAIPNYRSKTNGETNTLSFEQMLEGKTALCREQAMLLNSALARQGIQSKIIITGKHAWVRATVNQPGSKCDGKTFDLDTTWYKSFVPLEVRN